MFFKSVTIFSKGTADQERMLHSTLKNKIAAPKKVRDLGFDKDSFNGKSHKLLYDRLWQSKYCCFQNPDDTENTYFLIVINRNYFIFRVNGKKFVKRKMFSDKIKVKWNLMKHCLEKIKDLSSEQMLESGYALTTLDSHTFARSFPDGLFEGVLDRSFMDNNSLDNAHDNLLINIFEAKFEIDDVQFTQIEKVLQKTKPDDPLYEDIVAKKKKTTQIYDVKERKYYDAIENLKKKFDKDDKQVFETEQLKVLSS